MNLDDILRAEILKEYKSNKLDAILTTMEEGGEDWYRDTLVDEKKILSGPKERKKGGEIPVIGKAPCPVDHDDLLMDTKG